MIRTAHIDRTLHELADNDADAWRTWCERMGLDPASMPLDQQIVCDDSDFTITYTVAVEDDDGRWAVRDDEAVTQRLVKQLEARPLPFPRHGYATTQESAE